MYVVIDVFSRRMMALISRTPRTVASLLLVARACRAWGVPEQLSTDNGSDFVSKHFVLAMHQLGIHHRPTPKFSPDRKPFVERAIGTVQSKFMTRYEGIGYGGNSVAMRAKIEARSSFAARLGESEKERLGSTIHSGDLQDALSAWIANRYETAPHAGLRNRTPLDVWDEGTAIHVPRMASDEAIGLLLMPPARDEVRTVTRKGVTVDGIDYVSPNMVVGQRVQVRLDPADLGTVWVYTDTDPWQFVGLGTNLDLMGVDRVEAAAKIRALQADLVRQGKGEIRRLIRNADVHGVQRRFIGATPEEAPAPANITYLTPALEEAARAARTRGRREYEPATPEEIERHAAFVERVRADEESAPEETAAERFARWKALRARTDAGTEISADEAEWLRSYPTSGEWKAHRMDDVIAKSIDATVRRVDLSSDTMTKQAARHPELALGEYQQLPDLFRTGLAIGDANADSLQLFGLLRDSSGKLRLYRAVVKLTGSGEALFLTTFHRARAQQLGAALEEVAIRDAVELRSVRLSPQGIVE